MFQEVYSAVETETGEWLFAVTPHGQNNGLEGVRRDQSLRALGKWSVRIWWWDRCKTCEKKWKGNFCEVSVKCRLNWNLNWTSGLNRGVIHWNEERQGRKWKVWLVGKWVVLLGGWESDLQNTQQHPEVCILTTSLAVSFINTRRLGFPFCLGFPFYWKGEMGSSNVSVRYQYLKSLDNLKTAKRETENIFSPINNPQETQSLVLILPSFSWDMT